MASSPTLLIERTDIERVNVPSTSTVSETQVEASDQGLSHIESLVNVPGTLRYSPSMDQRFRVRKPFDVRLERSLGGVSALVQEIDEFGFGTSSGDALEDLGKTITELFMRLHHSVNLSPDLERVRDFVEAHLELISPRQ